MILEPGNWLGRGSYRPTDESLGLKFRANVDIADDVRGTPGLLVNAALDVDGGGAPSILVWIVPDEFGTYAVTVKGAGIDVHGTAKLDSEPNLALLWSEDGSAHVTCALFTLPETRGVRGFAKIGDNTWTWELALQPQHVALLGGKRRRSRAKDGKGLGNVVSLIDRLKR